MVRPTHTTWPSTSPRGRANATTLGWAAGWQPPGLAQRGDAAAREGALHLGEHLPLGDEGDVARCLLHQDAVCTRLGNVLEAPPRTVAGIDVC